MESWSQAGRPAERSHSSPEHEPHSHPLGQTLIVTNGTGWIQEGDGPIGIIRPGDVIQIPAGMKHWHGAAASTAMTDVALQEMQGGKNVLWLEKVSDQQYKAGELNSAEPR